jgi:hypothetical protein
VCFAKVTVLALVKILYFVTELFTYRRLPDDGFVKQKHLGAFIVIFNVNVNIFNAFRSYVEPRPTV